MLKDTLILFGTWMLYAFYPTNVHAQYYPPQPSTIPDLTVSAMVIQNITGNSCTFRYEVKNIGLLPMDLSKLHFTLSVSPTVAYNANTTVAAGDGIFSTAVWKLATGQSFSGTATATPVSQVSIEQYHYLSFYASPLPGNGSQEANYTNNNFTIDTYTAMADLEVSDIFIMNIHEDTITYEYTIRNAGTRTLYMDRFLLQGHVSEDTVLSPSTDYAASYVPFDGYPVLAPGASFTSSARAGTYVDFRKYKYLVIDVSLAPGKTHPHLRKNSDTTSNYIPNSFPDISMATLQIDSLIGDQVNYHIGLKNFGVAEVDYKKYDVEVYLSKDTSIQTALDIWVDTIGLPPILVGNAPFIAVSSFIADSNMYHYPYLVARVVLKPGYADPYESNPYNDARAYYIPNAFPDLTVTDVEITAQSSTSLTFNYSITSINSYVHLNQFYYQLYFSTDEVYDNADVLAGQSTFTNTDADIHPDSVYMHSASLVKTVNTNDYPYLIFIARSISTIDYEKDLLNNQFIAAIPFYSQPILWHRPTKYQVLQRDDLLTVENTSTQEQGNTYLLYNLNGEKISEGNFVQQKDIDTSNFKNGLYLLKLSDDSKTETIKFVVQH